MLNLQKKHIASSLIFCALVACSSSGGSGGGGGGGGGGLVLDSEDANLPPISANDVKNAILNNNNSNLSFSDFKSGIEGYTSGGARFTITGTADNFTIVSNDYNDDNTNFRSSEFTKDTANGLIKNSKTTSGYFKEEEYKITIDGNEEMVWLFSDDAELDFKDRVTSEFFGGDYNDLTPTEKAKVDNAITTSKEPTGEFDENNYNTIQTLAFNDTTDGVRLTYSNFGYLKIKENGTYNGKWGGIADSGTYNFTDFSGITYGNDAVATNSFQPNTTFTGKTFGQVTVYGAAGSRPYYNLNSIDSKSLTGNVELNIDGEDQKLKVNYDNYYTFNYTNGSYTDFTGNNNLGDSKFSIDNDDNAGGQANYQGYGETNATEIVGTNYYTKYNADGSRSIEINGVFGAVKNP
ncbi:MAG: hypothetical protein Ta2D_10250 [Rickettsiales bacterium]|nr:MAG: hypothetical protein Ta2D_10250 [Rickettsiales bacterium]